MTRLQLLAVVIPRGWLSAATGLLGAPGVVLADAGGDAKYLGVAAIVAAVFSGLVALIGAVAQALSTLRQLRTGPPSPGEVARAEAILARRDAAK